MAAPRAARSSWRAETTASVDTAGRIGTVNSFCGGSDAALERMRCFVPRPVSSNVTTEYAGALGEARLFSNNHGTMRSGNDGHETDSLPPQIRRVSVLFVMLNGVPPALEGTQAVARVALECVRAYDGFVKELTVDDKGMVLVAGFGVPPCVGEVRKEGLRLCGLQRNVDRARTPVTIVSLLTRSSLPELADARSSSRVGFGCRTMGACEPVLGCRPGENGHEIDADKG